MVSRNTGMTRQEAGRKGAEARWGRTYREDDDHRRSSRTSPYYEDDQRWTRNRREDEDRRTDLTDRQETGRRARTIYEEYDPQFYREIGSRNERRLQDRDRDYDRDFERRGRERTLDEYGPDFYAEFDRRIGLYRRNERDDLDFDDIRETRDDRRTRNLRDRRRIDDEDVDDLITSQRRTRDDDWILIRRDEYDRRRDRREF